MVVEVHPTRSSGRSAKRDIPDKPFTDLCGEKKGDFGENRVIEQFERANEPFIDLAKMDRELAWIGGGRYIRCPDFLRFSLPRTEAVESKARCYAPEISSLSEQHLCIRQDRMDDYLQFNRWSPVALHVYVDEEDTSYWQYVSKLDGLSNHEQLDEEDQYVNGNRVYWYPLEKFNCLLF